MLWRMSADPCRGRIGTMFIHSPSVVSTEAPLDFARGKLHAEWRDLLSTISCLSSREGLSTPPRVACPERSRGARLRSRRRKLVAETAEIPEAAHDTHDARRCLGTYTLCVYGPPVPWGD